MTKHQLTRKVSGILPIFWILLLLLSSTGCSDSTESSKPKLIDRNDLRYEMNSEAATVEITDYTGKHREIIIPSEVNDFIVTGIGEMAFNNKRLKHVTIPNTVKYIKGVEDISSNINNQRGAFAHNNLESITIPNSVEFIGAGAFRHNHIKSLSIPESVTTIEKYAFASNLIETIVIPDHITSIGHTAFRDNRIDTITIGDGVDVDPTAFNTSWSTQHPGADTNFTVIYDMQGGLFKRPSYTLNVWTRM